MILTLETLAIVSRDLRTQGKVIVLANGCFDPLHIGHMRYLNSAKKLGDVLMVTVTQDAHVNKGPDRPLFPAKVRCEALTHLRCVDYVCVNAPVPGEAIRMLQPHVYAKGADYKGKPLSRDLFFEKEVVEGIGGRLVFTDDEAFHSTDLIRRLGL